MGKGQLFIFSARHFIFCIFFGMSVLLWTNGARAEFAGHKAIAEQPETFEASSSCSICHQNIYKQFSESMHGKSFTNPVFIKMFFDVLLPRYAKDETLVNEVKECMACHSPVTYARTESKVFTLQGVDPEFTGVECDLCHRITGFDGLRPQNGNFIAEPGMQKYGPFQHQSDWHHVYLELQTKSEFCAICHERTNRLGLAIKTTFTEWQKSRYAKMGIECQDCHMNANGFLTGGKPMYDSGRASQNSLATSPQRDKLYTHRFPGAHSKSQVKGAIRLRIQVEESALVAGEETTIYVTVDNSKSGHKLPTGSAELRLVYLDLVAQVNGETVPLLPKSFNGKMFDVSGQGEFDAEILGESFPGGRRLYRAICVDADEQQTLYAFDAQKMIFDNRLQADEIRKEYFTFKVPEDIDQDVALVAQLYYLRYPDTFAEKLGVKKAKPVKLASARKKIVFSRQQ